LVRIAQTCFCRSGGLAPISFPLFQGIRLGVGSEKLALSCMVVLLWLQRRTTLPCVPEGFELVSVSANSDHFWILASDSRDAIDPEPTLGGSQFRSAASH
jgi:hypothetical protein